MEMRVNIEDVIFNGKPIRKEDSNSMLELLKRIHNEGTGQGVIGTMDYTFDRGCVGWKSERTMMLGLEFQKLLLKMQHDGLHIDIDIPVEEGRKDKYTRFYSGPNLIIDEEEQKVKVTGLAHLNAHQFEDFMREADKVYCRVMDVDYQKVATAAENKEKEGV